MIMDTSVANLSSGCCSTFIMPQKLSIFIPIYDCAIRINEDISTELNLVPSVS